MLASAAKTEALTRVLPLKIAFRWCAGTTPSLRPSTPSAPSAAACTTSSTPTPSERREGLLQHVWATRLLLKESRPKWPRWRARPLRAPS